MKILLDTHALIWFIDGDEQLPSKSLSIIKDLKNNCFVSIASIWEIGIKISLNKLKFKGGFNDLSNFLEKNQIELLPLTFEHIHKLISLKFHHKDPFDRVIISQSIIEKMSIISKDENFKKYKVNLVWD